MVLAVEIGNTHISLGGFDGDDCKFVAPIATAPKRTGVEIAWELKGVFSLFGLQANQFHAAIVGSVVPTKMCIRDRNMTKEAIGSKRA